MFTFKRNAKPKGSDQKGGANGQSNVVSEMLSSKSPLLDGLADKLKNDWKKLASSCKFYEDEIEFIESEHKELNLQARRMLILWIERRDPEEATLTQLQRSISQAQLSVRIH